MRMAKLMMATFLILSSLFLNAFADQKIYFLTSLNNPADIKIGSLKITPKPILYIGRDYDIEETVFKRFQDRFFKNGTEVIMKSHATVSDLAVALQDEDALAVIWLSHSNFRQDVGVAFQAEDTILDAHGVNVAPLFQKIHTNIRFVGLLGCSAQKILDSYRALGSYKQNYNLSFLAYEKPVSQKRSVDDAASKLSKILKKSEDQFLTIKNHWPKIGAAVEIERTIKTEKDKLGVQVMMGERLLHYFPPAKKGDVQQATVYLDQYRTSDFDIKVNSGAGHGYKGVFEIGGLKISSDEYPYRMLAWKKFPFGKHFHVYRAKSFGDE